MFHWLFWCLNPPFYSAEDSYYSRLQWAWWSQSLRFWVIHLSSFSSDIYNDYAGPVFRRFEAVCVHGTCFCFSNRGIVYIFAGRPSFLRNRHDDILYSLDFYQEKIRCRHRWKVQSTDTFNSSGDGSITLINDFHADNGFDVICESFLNFGALQFWYFKLNNIHNHLARSRWQSTLMLCFWF